MTMGIRKEAILDLYCTTFPESLVIADLGCSSGPNTLMVISEILEAIDERCRKLNRPLPEFLVFLNDLPLNDFNTVFRSFPSFYETLKLEKGDDFGPCLITPVPGSFHGWLFPRRSLHFVHSSSCLHWLSQVPPGITNNPLHKRNFYISKTSPPIVYKSYLEQFQKDFSRFLMARSEEIIPGGRMFVTLLGRKCVDAYDIEYLYVLELLARILYGMVSQGLVEEEKVDSFKLPVYMPSTEELKAVIQTEGSFVVNLLEILEVTADVEGIVDENGLVMAQMVAKSLRAVIESMLASHFGEGIVEELFQRLADIIAKYNPKVPVKLIYLTLSMTKKSIEAN
ncbi:putative jasmonic acid carboxyl methyltransferase 2 [Tasmannia lanceolata]|uniref:putative jasmonic acid carboxyl methyltransferase 2 n=1 Tax=Tasmannia lanceolata TaxID=3420 RepID=UPI00406391E7